MKERDPWRIVALVIVIAVVVLALLGAWAQWASSAAKGPARVFAAQAERVLDGDTVVYPQGSCRLLGIDAPERKHGAGRTGQPLAEESFQALRQELMRGINTVLVYGTDRYGRMLCIVIDPSGYVANLWMVESGWGEAFMLESSPFAEGILTAEQRAKAEKRGIWSLPVYERPADYRKRTKGE